MGRIKEQLERDEILAREREESDYWLGRVNLDVDALAEYIERDKNKTNEVPDLIKHILDGIYNIKSYVKP